MYGMLSGIAAIAAVFLSMTMTVHAILAGRRSAGFTETKYFMKNDFAKGALPPVALPLLVHFALGAVRPGTGWWRSPVFTAVESVVTLSFTVAPVVTITRIVNRSHYTLLRGGSPAEFGHMYGTVTTDPPTAVPFETGRYDVRGILYRLYPRMMAESGSIPSGEEPVAGMGNRRFNAFHAHLCTVVAGIVRGTNDDPCGTLRGLMEGEDPGDVHAEWYAGRGFGRGRGLLRPYVQDPVGTCTVCSTGPRDMLDRGWGRREVKTCTLIPGLSLPYGPGAPRDGDRVSGGVSASGSDRVAGAVSSLLSPAVVVSLTVTAVWSSAGDVPVPRLVLCTVLLGPVRHMAATGRFTVGDGDRDRGRGYAPVLSSHGLCTAMMLNHPDSPLTPVSPCMRVCAVPMGSPTRRPRSACTAGACPPARRCCRSRSGRCCAIGRVEQAAPGEAHTREGAARHRDRAGGAAGGGCPMVRVTGG